MSEPSAEVTLPNESEGIDIGSGHRLWWREDGDLWWLHHGCAYHHVDVTSGTRHRLQSRDPITIEGSLLCVGKGTHGFVENGQWRDA